MNKHWSFLVFVQSKGQDIVQRSVLGPVLPEAMVCYLENYEAERFSEIFLGEFDTPEAIWSSEMRWERIFLIAVNSVSSADVNLIHRFVFFRRMMIEKIAAHIADFSPRLQSNTRALYQYCPIPAVSFPQLDNELFCNIYYLRHLCDTIRFPNWPIRDAVSVLSLVGLRVLFLKVLLLTAVAAGVGEAIERHSWSLEEGGGEEASFHVCGWRLWCAEPPQRTGPVSGGNVLVLFF